MSMYATPMGVGAGLSSLGSSMLQGYQQGQQIQYQRAMQQAMLANELANSEVQRQQRAAMANYANYRAGHPEDTSPYLMPSGQLMPGGMGMGGPMPGAATGMGMGMGSQPSAAAAGLPDPDVTSGLRPPAPVIAAAVPGGAPSPAAAPAAAGPAGGPGSVPSVLNGVIDPNKLRFDTADTGGASAPTQGLPQPNGRPASNGAGNVTMPTQAVPQIQWGQSQAGDKLLSGLALQGAKNANQMQLAKMGIGMGSIYRYELPDIRQALGQRLNNQVNAVERFLPAHNDAIDVAAAYMATQPGPSQATFQSWAAKNPTVSALISQAGGDSQQLAQMFENKALVAAQEIPGLQGSQRSLTPDEIKQERGTFYPQLSQLANATPDAFAAAFNTPIHNFVNGPYTAAIKLLEQSRDRTTGAYPTPWRETMHDNLTSIYNDTLSNLHTLPGYQMGPQGQMVIPSVPVQAPAGQVPAGGGTNWDAVFGGGK